MFQELGAWSLKRKMANSTDFHVTFFGPSAWAAATHGRKRHASMAMRVNCLAKLGIFTLRYHTSATGCSAPTRGNPSSPELFSCLAYMESLWRSVRQVSPSGKPCPWTEMRILQSQIKLSVQRSILRMNAERYTHGRGTKQQGQVAASPEQASGVCVQQCS